MPPAKKKKKPPAKKKTCNLCKKFMEELSLVQNDYIGCLETNDNQLRRLAVLGLLEIRIAELESMLDDVIDEKTQLEENCTQLKNQLQKQAQTFGMEAA